MLSSCAGPYHALNLERMNFDNLQLEGPILYGVKEDVMQKARNRKVARRSKRYKWRTVAVRITNSSYVEIECDSLKFFAGDDQVFPLNKEKYYENLKQQPYTYLPYLLVVPVIEAEVECPTGGNCNKSFAIPFGIPIAAGNFAVALVANKRLKADLAKYSISGKRIKPGETVYGLVSFYNHNPRPVRIKR